MKQMKIIKRSGEEVPFVFENLGNAIRKAAVTADVSVVYSNDSVGSRHGHEDARIRRFREIVATVAHKNRKIRDQAREAAPFYCGETDAAEPKVLLEKALNPKFNGSYACMKELGEAAKALRPGEFPPDALRVFFDTTMLLIENDLEHLLRDPAMNWQKTLLVDFKDYVSSSTADFSPAAHAREIDTFIKNWNTACYANSDAFYKKYTDILNSRHPSPARQKPQRTSRRASSKRAGCALHGMQTKRMRKQLKDFVEFLKANPVNENVSCGTVAARAQQFWQKNSKTFERATGASGEKRGYKDAKKLAGAYRTSRS